MLDSSETEARVSFALASGTTIGYDHSRTGRNNQDAYKIIQTPEVTVAVVCDGCSSGVNGVSHNELGAWIGACAVAEETYRIVTSPSWEWPAGFAAP
jgi:hypothetical protein